MKIRLLNQKYSLTEIWKLKKPLLKAGLNPKKFFNLILAFISQKFRLTKVLNQPTIVMIEPSARCNLKCPMCPTTLNKNKRQIGELNFEIYKKLIDEIGDYLITIPLYNYGEPLLNPDLPKMISYAKKKNIITIVSTNGMLLGESINRQLINSGLDYLILSFDGATKKTYEKYRKGANFEKVVSNLKSLIKIRKELKKLNPFINLQFIVMKENEHEIPEIKKTAKQLGVDKLSLKKVVFLKGKLKDLVPKNEKYISKQFKEKIILKSCNKPWQSSVINWDGSVVPCCVDIDLDLKYNLGNISQKKFKTIWNDKPYQNFRKKILEDIKKIDICQQCLENNFSIDMFIE